MTYMIGYTLISSQEYEDAIPKGLIPPFTIKKKKGTIAAISQGPIGYLAYVEFEAGVIRANHYHKKKREHFFIIDGQIDLYIRHYKEDNKNNICKHLVKGDLLIIEPYYSHAFSSNGNGSAIEFCEQSFEKVREDKVRDYVL